MTELVWKGKGKPRKSARAVSLRTDEVHGAGEEPNRLVLGDASEVLNALGAPFAERVALIYVDPPFNTGQRFEFRTSVPGSVGHPRVAVEAYRDDRGLDAWLSWFFGIAMQLRDLLVPGGSIYVHLDAHVAHYAKVLLDEVFGIEAFQREIIWRIGWVSGFKSRARGWIRNHDTLLFYAKGGRPSVFHTEYAPYPTGYVRRDGTPPRGAGFPVEDVWNASRTDSMDSIQIKSFSGEKLGYPTQKNEALVARIVRASSRAGDLVLDCFSGSGTTAAVAEKLGRRWIASDSSPVSIHTTRKRLISKPGFQPLVVQSVRSDRRHGIAKRRGMLRLRAPVVAGRHVVVEIESLRFPKLDVPELARVKIAHWSQWIDAWCVDWDHRRGPLNASAYVCRKGSGGHLDLALDHTYAKPGSYVALVKVFDLIGGFATATLDLVVE